MVRLKSDLNPEEEQGLPEGPTRYETSVNRFETSCGTCGGTYYVDEETSDSISAAVEKGLDNPFVCPDCEEEEYDEQAHGG